jgi:hypothetical protein
VSVAGEITEMIGRVLGIRSELRSSIGGGIANDDERGIHLPND